MRVGELGLEPGDLDTRARSKPTPFCRRTAPMAVGAAHVAFFDLPRDLSPRSAPRKLADVPGLSIRISVVKIEEYWVSLAAVDARMLGEISAQ